MKWNKYIELFVSGFRKKKKILNLVLRKLLLSLSKGIERPIIYRRTIEESHIDLNGRGKTSPQNIRLMRNPKDTFGSLLPGKCVCVMFFSSKFHFRKFWGRKYLISLLYSVLVLCPQCLSSI